MYRYSNCRHPYPHRITGDGHRALLHGLELIPVVSVQRVFWTDEEIEELVQMYHRNLTFAHIADVLDREQSSVAKKVEELISKGLKRRPGIRSLLSGKRKEYVRRHYPVRGLDYCVKHLGLSPSTVRHYAHEMGLREEACV